MSWGGGTGSSMADGRRGAPVRGNVTVAASVSSSTTGYRAAMGSSPRNQSAPLPGLYTRLAGLGLVIEGYETERAELDVSSGFLRVTTTVVLRGGGHEGRGEDVTYAAEDHEPYPLALPLAGDWTLDGFSQRVGGLDLFPDRPPQMEFFRNYRRWAFESAALDLALRQRGQSAGRGARARLPAAALRRLDAPRHHSLACRGPGARVQARPDARVGRGDDDAHRRDRPRARARLQGVLRGLAGGQPARPGAVPCRGRCGFPDAVLEDPALTGPAREALDGEEGRFSFDAPIHSWADVEAVADRALAGGSRRCAT